jgi:hypothetical protein
MVDTTAELKLPRAANAKDGKAIVMGAAWLDDYLYLLDFAGPQALIKSMWATMVAADKSNHGIDIKGPGIRAMGKKLAKPAETRKVQLRGTQYQSWLSYHKPDPNNLVYVTNPDLIGVTDPVTRDRAKQDPVMHAMLANRLVKAINRTSKAVVLPEWGDAVIEYLLDHYTLDNAFTQLETYGSVLFALRLNPLFAWEKLISEMLAERAITIPTPPAIPPRGAGHVDDYRLM